MVLELQSSKTVHMKKTIIILFVFLVGTVSASAQIFRLGGKLGTTVSKINGVAFDEKFQYGFHAGGFVQLKLSKKLTLQPELMFNQVNTSVDSNFHTIYTSLGSANYLRNIQLKYLSIPLVANYNLGKAVALQGGVQYGKLLSSSQSLVQNGQSAFKNGDFSVLAGVQFQVSKFVVSGRYIIGLNNLNDLDNQSQWKGQSLQASVGFRF
jgi:hypothetical protein